MNAELIAELRGHIREVPLKLLHDAADALEAAEKRIAELEKRLSKEGEWIGEGDGYADGEMVYDMWSCSECGEYFDEWDDRPTWNYCPNCGAKMKGEQK